jgi:hypothetical protein
LIRPSAEDIGTDKVMKRKVLRAFFDVAKRCMQACIDLNLKY